MPDDNPQTLAGAVNQLPRPWLIGVDVDGTLAPIVATPELARLAPGALTALEDLAARVGAMVAVISGRPLVDLHHQFGIPTTLMVFGSHGAEVGTEVDSRTPEEQRQIESLVELLDEIVAELPGSWIEHKPLAVALHVRQAEPRQAAVAIEQLTATLSSWPDLTMHPGHKVLEIAVRPMTKATAFDQLRMRLEPRTAVFIGDDASDELVFESLASSDVSVKVGLGPTAAKYRLGGPDEVVLFLQTLAQSG